MPVTEIKSVNQFSDLTNEIPAGKLVALYFHTPWADPCIEMNSVFSSLSNVYSSHVFLSIDADDFPDIAEAFEVSAVPYFVFLKDEGIVKELPGSDSKELAKAVQALASSNPSAGSSRGNDKTASATHQEEDEEEDEEDEESEEQLNQRLKKLISAAPVMLFMKGTPAEPRCGFSRQLVGILRDHQVKFGFFDILKDNSVREGLKKFSDWPTFPQLYVNGELQGGLDIVKESISEDPDFFKNAVAT